MYKIVSLVALVLLLAPCVLAGRPEYQFPDTVFRNIPPMPEDFWAKKALFDTQQITAVQLTEEYYLQPELYPGWNYSANKSYTNKDRMVGVYGVNAYPSRFDVFMSNYTETFDISFILLTGFGVEIYQGAKLVPVHSTNISVELKSHSSDTFLLTPTYPEFSDKWARIITYTITASVYGEEIIDIMENTPDKETDVRWSGLYPNLYTSGGSILGLRIPKTRIYIHGVDAPTEQNIRPPEGINYFPYLFIIALIILALVVWRIHNGRRKRRDKKEKTETKTS